MPVPGVNPTGPYSNEFEIAVLLLVNVMSAEVPVILVAELTVGAKQSTTLTTTSSELVHPASV